MNAALNALRYAGTGAADMLTIASSSGVLDGLLDYASINAAAPGPVNGDLGLASSEAETASFGLGTGLVQMTTAAAPGAMLVQGMEDFADTLQVNGISGTALLVDAGGTAIFDPAAVVTLGGDVTLGDASGAGTLAVETQGFSTSGNVTIAGTAGAAGNVAEILGGLSATGSLTLGAGGTLDLTGTLSVGAATLGSLGTLLAL